MSTKTSALQKALAKVAERANRKAFKQMNARRKKMGLPLATYNPARTYWA